MTSPTQAASKSPFLAFLFVALVFGCVRPAFAESPAGGITIQNVNDMGDRIEFGFTSSWPPGTSYQAQYLRTLGNVWVDIPDASIEPTEVAGEFQVTAPMFGGNSGFYRVFNAVSLPTDPIMDTLGERDPEEIILIWNQRGADFSQNPVRGRLFYHVTATPGGSIQNNLLRSYPDPDSPAFDFDATLATDASGAQDILLADLTGDGRADPLIACVSPEGFITLAFVNLAAADFSWAMSFRFHLEHLQVRPADTVPPVIRLLAANLHDGQGTEVVLAYTGADGAVHFVVLKFAPDLGSVEIEAEFTAAPLPFVRSGGLQDRSGRFDIAVGDFDGDGFDEIALLAAEAITVPDGIENWQLKVRFFDFDANEFQFVADTIPAQDSVLYIHDNRTNRWLSRVAAHAADFNGDGRAELAAAYHVAFAGQSSFWYLQIVKPGGDLASVSFGPDQRMQVDSTSGTNGYPLCLLTGEFDGDPAPELVYGARQLFIYNVGTDLSLNHLATGGLNTDSETDARRFLALAQLDNRDPNIGYRPEIVSVVDSLINGNSQRRFTVRTYKVTGDPQDFLSISPDAVIQGEVSSNAPRFFALGTADMGGNGVKLGTPRRFSRTVTGKPIVIVNSPPVHFTVLDGTEYDVNRLFPVGACAGSGTCNFFSRYSGSTTQGVTVEKRWERGWDFSATVSGGFTVPIIDVGVGVEVQTKFGEQLDSYTSQAETTRVEVQVDAVGEDRIYAATITYTIWEYPVLVDGETVGHVVVIDPGVTSQNWFGSKSIVAQNYRQYHEVGNLLSYRSTTQPYDGADFVRNIISADTFTVDSSSSFIWRLTRTVGSTTTESKTFNFAVNASADFDIPIPFIPNVKLEGGYDSSRLRSSTSTITDEQGMAAYLGNLEGSIAGTAYSITPFVYWDRSGAVVLDYAVTLPAGTPSIPTFWGQNYSAKSDPAFILPWRLDPEKGNNLPHPSLRQLTREIATIPAEPRPGEEVRLLARISNFSLLGTPGTFKVRFYLGDPAHGGTLITATDGRTEVLAPASIPAQGKAIVELPWRIPADATATSLQVYAVIDPDNQIDEIHEDNNIGWNEIFLRRTP